MFQRLKQRFTAWIIAFAMQRLVNLGVEAITELPWHAWGQAANAATDKKFTPKYANQVQTAIGEGLLKLKAGLTA